MCNAVLGVGTVISPGLLSAVCSFVPVNSSAYKLNSSILMCSHKHVKALISFLCETCNITIFFVCKLWKVVVWDMAWRGYCFILTCASFWDWGTCKRLESKVLVHPRMLKKIHNKFRRKLDFNFGRCPKIRIVNGKWGLVDSSLMPYLQQPHSYVFTTFGSLKSS